MRRLLVTVDAGERECGACRHVAVGRLGTRCDLFDAPLRRMSEHVYARVLPCRTTEAAAARPGLTRDAIDAIDAVTRAAAECIRMAHEVHDLVDASKGDRREMVERLDARLRGACEALNDVRRQAAEQKEAGRP